MENSDNKRRSVPGVRDVVLQIRGISDSIKAIDAEIKEALARISAINEESRANSKRVGLRAELQTISEALKPLYERRKLYSDQMNSYKDSIDKLRETSAKDKTMVQIKNPEDIEAKMEKLNMRLISESISVTEEKKIAAELLALRTMKTRLGDLEDSRNKIRNIDMLMKECKAQLAEVSKEIAKLVARKTEVKAELDKVAGEEKAKSPEAMRLEAKVTGLKAQKQDLIGQKEKKREKIAEIEAEYAKLEVLIEEQRGLEEKKGMINKEIEALKSKKELLLSGASALDPKVFDTLCFTLSAYRGKSNFYLDVGVAMLLQKHGVLIPSTAEEVETALAQLSEKKSNFAVSYRKHVESLNGDIAGIDAEIADKVSKLGELPPTDVELLRKAGRGIRF